MIVGWLSNDPTPTGRTVPRNSATSSSLVRPRQKRKHYSRTAGNGQSCHEIWKKSAVSLTTRLQRSCPVGSLASLETLTLRSHDCQPMCGPAAPHGATDNSPGQAGRRRRPTCPGMPKRQHASVEPLASQYSGALPRPKAPALGLALDRGCDVRRGVMRPRSTAGVLVVFSLGRRQIRLVYPGLRWVSAPPNLSWAIFGRPLRGLQGLLSVRVSDLAGGVRQTGGRNPTANWAENC